MAKNSSAMQETWVQSLCQKLLWRKEWLPTLVLLLGEFHGLYSPWGRKELNTTERLSLSLFTFSPSKWREPDSKVINLSKEGEMKGRF